MPNFLVKVENDAAEKLMSYLTAYRKMMSEKPLIPEENKEIASIFIAEPMPSQTKISRKTGQNLQKPICL
jgi:dsDNA-binding SOS-regulon protein